jgi:hypothetical protein
MLVLFLKGFISCSQERYGIRKISAFFTEKFPGNIPVDENGKSLFNGPDTLITIYVEISGKGPEWKTAWANDKCYTVYSSLVSQTPYEAGTKAKDDKKVILKPATGNKLWQLTLQKVDQTNQVPRKIKPGEILLSGKYLKKTIFRKLDSLVQLTTFPSV